jgi:signal transduction histidine kinase
MASRSTEAVPISGRVDHDGRLVSADAALERLQVEAGSALGRALALPQIAALARAAASRGVPLSRALVAADSQHDLDLFVRAEPVDGEGGQAGEVQLTIERWAARPMAPPRLALVETADDDERRAAEASTLEFETDAALNLVDLSPALAGLLGQEAGALQGRPLTSLFRLIEEADGSMPLLAAVATRGRVDGQRAEPRGGGPELTIDAEPLFDDQGRFAGFHAHVRGQAGDPAVSADPASAFEDSLDEALRSPLARIISAADHIVERGDGPLRSDYANYASDIAAAGRHLLSVIRSMGAGAAAEAQRLDLATLAAEAVALVQPLADARRIAVTVDSPERPLRVDGERGGIVQILVNILGNAIRHSPEAGLVAIRFDADPSHCRVTVADEGPGIAADDQQRIFERYEQVGDRPDGSGLGLAIARRLARSMGGDITLEAAPGEGARFTLVLPPAG